MAMWFEETYNDRLRFSLRSGHLLHRSQSEFQTIEIFETDVFGRALTLDGVYQTSVGDEFMYHEMLVHPALTTAPSIKRVLVIGGGDGGTVREVLRYQEVEHVTMCELDRQVVDACREHLSAFDVPWDDPRLQVLYRDGVAFLKEQAEQRRGQPFDVILVDGPDPVGPAEGLFRSPFYEACRAALAPAGVLAQQTEAPFLMRADFIRIIKTLRGVFPRAMPYFGFVPIYVSGQWSFCHASESVEAREPLAERLSQIDATCRYYNADIHRAAFAQSNDIRHALAG
jgi:spermidine synthase